VYQSLTGRPDWALVPAKPAQRLNTTTNNNMTANYYVPFFYFSVQLFSIFTAKDYWESTGMKFIL
jgi:hypothetical protein